MSNDQQSTGITAYQRRQGQLQKTLRSVLERGRSRYENLLPKHMTPDRMIHVALTAANKTPKLLDCSAASIGGALLTASQIGLEPDGYHGHLIPYKETCQFIPDYKGLIQLALNNGVVVDAHAVYENDYFAYNLGVKPDLVHTPNLDGDSGKLKCAYAVAHFKDGRTKFVVATRAEVEKRRNASASSNKRDSPWQQWEDEMWIKTAVKMLMKYIPRSPELTLAVTADDTAEMGLQQAPLDAPGIRHQQQDDRPSRSDEALQRMNHKAGAGEIDTVGMMQALQDSLAAAESEDAARQVYESIVSPNREKLSEDAILEAESLLDERIKSFMMYGQSGT